MAVQPKARGASGGREVSLFGDGVRVGQACARCCSGGAAGLAFREVRGGLACVRLLCAFSMNVCFSEGLCRNKTCLVLKPARGCETIEAVDTVLLLETRCVRSKVTSELRFVVTAHCTQDSP